MGRSELATGYEPYDHGLVTALPTSPTPVTGDRCVFTDSLTSPTYYWELIYNSGDTGSYDWGVIGGSPVYAQDSDSRSLTNQTSYTDLPTDPISFDLPLAGDYWIEVAATIVLPNTSAALGAISYAVEGTAASDTWASFEQGAGTDGFHQSLPHKWLHTSLASATTIAEKARTAGNYTVTFGRRRIWAMPVRVG